MCVCMSVNPNLKAAQNWGGDGVRLIIYRCIQRYSYICIYVCVCIHMYIYNGAGGCSRFGRERGEYIDVYKDI